MSKKNQFNALILAAGFGTRLGKLGASTPKGLFKSNGNQSIVEKIVKQLKTISTHSTTLLSNNLFFKQFDDFLKNNFSDADINLLNNNVDNAHDRLGAIGDLLYSIKKLNWWNNDLLLLPSDTLFNFSLGDFIDFAQKHDEGFTTVVRKMDSVSEIRGRLGCAVLDKNKKIINFKEKPKNPPSRYAAIPFYYYPRKILALLKDYKKEFISNQSKMDAPGNIIPWLIKRGVPVYAYVTDKATLDIGTPKDLEKFKKIGS